MPRLYLIPTIYAICIFGSILPTTVGTGKQKTNIPSLRLVITTPVLLYVLYQIPKTTCGDAAQDSVLFLNGFLILVRWVDYMILNVPEQAFRRIPTVEEDSTKEKGVDSGAPEEMTLAKLKWSVALWTTFRGVGWNWKVRNIPAAAPIGTSRW